MPWPVSCSARFCGAPGAVALVTTSTAALWPDTDSWPLDWRTEATA
jgi:hypothetical protein